MYCLAYHIGNTKNRIKSAICLKRQILKLLEANLMLQVQQLAVDGDGEEDDGKEDEVPTPTHFTTTTKITTAIIGKMILQYIRKSVTKKVWSSHRRNNNPTTPLTLYSRTRRSVGWPVELSSKRLVCV